MTVFAGAVDATFAAFGIDATYTPAGGEPVGVRGRVAKTPGEPTRHLGTGLQRQIRIGVQAIQIRMHGTGRDQCTR